MLLFVVTLHSLSVCASVHSARCNQVSLSSHIQIYQSPILLLGLMETSWAVSLYHLECTFIVALCFAPPSLKPCALQRLLKLCTSTRSSSDCFALPSLSLPAARLAAPTPRRRRGLTRQPRNILVFSFYLPPYPSTG